MRRIVSSLTPLVLLATGLALAFGRFWTSHLDAISGDAIDARFNALILEHTWLWLTGAHASLFDAPMFHPHPNAYAYSDTLFGVAPIYWAFRAAGLDFLLSFQLWIVACSALNFAAFFAFLRRSFALENAWAALGAFVFAFGLPRTFHVEHAQLVPQFYVVLSAAGAMTWWRDPASRRGPILFYLGAGLQFATAFYYVWFWVWTLAVFAAVLLARPAGRERLRGWFARIERRFALGGALLLAAAISPFLYHYALSAREFGAIRGWVSISDGAPRLVSWFYLPPDHWQWFLVPFKDWARKLPMHHEHILSFGWATWIAMALAARWAWRGPYRYLVWPLLAMFAFTISIGRFTTWGFMTFLFPAGGAIRVPNRVHIFLLVAWAPLFALFVRSLWRENRRAFAAAILALFFAESAYVGTSKLSRAAELARLGTLAARVPADCRVLGYVDGLRDWIDLPNVDAVAVAWTTGRAALNGYSGQRPEAYRRLLFNFDPDRVGAEKHRASLLAGPLASWYAEHGQTPEGVCLLDSTR